MKKLMNINLYNLINHVEKKQTKKNYNFSFLKDYYSREDLIDVLNQRIPGIHIIDLYTYKYKISSYDEYFYKVSFPKEDF